MSEVPTRLRSSAFAARHGVTPATVSLWVRKNWVVRDAEGWVDVAASDALLERYRDPNDLRQHSARKAPVNAPPPSLSPDAAAALARIMAAAPAQGRAVPPPMQALPDGEIEDGESVEDAAARIVALEGARVSTEEARRVKENYLALQNKLQYEKDSGSVIPLDVAETVLFEEARAVRNAWLNWPTKFGALIAADLGLEADKVTEVLTGYVHRQIASLGEPDADFQR